jgi:hypothetical protein
MTTYGMSLKDKHSNLEILLNPARVTGDRVGLVIGNETYWMRSTIVLNLQRDLADQLENTNTSEKTLFDLSPYGITTPVNLLDVRALSNFLLKIHSLLQADAEQI